MLALRRAILNTVISKDRTTIAYNKAGQGPAVILVDGAFNTRTSGPNMSLVPLLAQHFTVYHHDRRGRGDSGDTSPYAIEREIEDIDALIDEAGGSAYVYGISSGAALALEAPNRLTTRIKKLALFEAPFVVDASRPRIPVDFASHLNELVESNHRGKAVRYFMTEGVHIPRIFVFMMQLMPAWGKMKALVNSTVYDAQILKNNGAGTPLDAGQWKSVTAPTLVVDGGKSPMWMRNAMQALATALPGAKYTTLAGQMHIVQAEVLAPVLIDFFKS
jgi:pimeloyl-ACP methyl ester carboxylesterase